jgi:hypothetical protein
MSLYSGTEPTLSERIATDQIGSFLSKDEQAVAFFGSKDMGGRWGNNNDYVLILTDKRLLEMSIDKSLKTKITDSMLLNDITQVAITIKRIRSGLYLMVSSVLLLTTRLVIDHDIPLNDLAWILFGMFGCYTFFT